MKTSGYSGTPLAKKLGIKNGFKIKIVNEPEGYFELFLDLPEDLKKIADIKTKKDFIHFFTKNASQLDNAIKELKQEMEQNGMLWISWPKKASKVETDLNGNIVREIGLKNGLVDIKVCAINDVWSGLKFVIPVKDRV
ncbi:DUF3052 domain-containing protein [Winogradskyella haliclonae]|uniref:DUF3052 domain-containing protein n=1 Tax=Winogradskyella haliclonae TaxID=2048558 RepID=A0ABQ2BVK9_9FLAO|nr:DUF3052 domain-containing protein [Winogradskyella haliclonae]GGI55768.1 DUF3052 domain-containing protein [Winogradskyella haliclonae]